MQVAPGSSPHCHYPPASSLDIFRQQAGITNWTSFYVNRFPKSHEILFASKISQHLEKFTKMQNYKMRHTSEMSSIFL